MPDFETLRIERRRRVLTIVMNRPERLNAFDAALHMELAAALGWAAADEESDVLVLTGEGRAFSAGGDLTWQHDAAANPHTFERTVREARQIVYGILDCEKPIIAKINGPAVGLGATIAVLCDVSIAASSAYLSDPHVNVGMVAGDGGAAIWPQLVGYARAKHYLLTGERISASAALAIGLITQVVHEEELDAAVEVYADRLLAGAQLAIRYTKVTINAALRQVMGAVLDVGLGYESVTNVSPDHREALAAFREKRSPRFGRALD